MEDRSKRSRTLDVDSEDESEFSLNEFEGFEVTGGTLGARAPPPVPSEYTSSALGHRSNFPQGHGNQNNSASHPTFAKQHPFHNKPKHDPAAQKPPTFTLGAQKQHQEKATLSGTYDVFAPSGPIGIEIGLSIWRGCCFGRN